MKYYISANAFLSHGSINNHSKYKSCPTSNSLSSNEPHLSASHSLDFSHFHKNPLPREGAIILLSYPWWLTINIVGVRRRSPSSTRHLQILKGTEDITPPRRGREGLGDILGAGDYCSEHYCGKGFHGGLSVSFCFYILIFWCRWAKSRLNEPRWLVVLEEVGRLRHCDLSFVNKGRYRTSYVIYFNKVEKVCIIRSSFTMIWNLSVVRPKPHNRRQNPNKNRKSRRQWHKIFEIYDTAAPFTPNLCTIDHDGISILLPPIPHKMRFIGSSTASPPPTRRIGNNRHEIPSRN